MAALITKEAPNKEAPKTKRRVIFNVAVVLLFVAPVLFATAWMWSLWDPSHYLSDVKLAVVNDDGGTTDKDTGKQVNYGNDVVKGLLDTDYLNVTKTTDHEANTGLRDGEYMVVIQIPKDFSANVASVIDKHPKQAQVLIGYNDHYGTNTPLLTSGLVPGIQAGIAKGISTGYGKKILDGMNQLGGGLKQASDGAKQLDDGAGQLRDGVRQGVDGAKQLDDGMGQLLDGTHQLGDGSAQIDDGVGQLTGKLIPLLRQVGASAENLRPLIGALEQAGMHDKAAELQQTLAQLDNNNPQALANQLQKLKDGTAEMRYNLTNPSAPYLSGVLKLKDGTRQLREGTNLLYDGTGKLKDGTSQLSTGLADGAKKAPHISDIPASSNQIAVPVSYDQNYLYPVQTQKDLNDPTSKVLSAGVTLILVLVFGYLVMALASMLTPVIFGLRKRHGAVRQVLSGFLLLAVVNAVLLLLITLISKAVGFHVEHGMGYTVTLAMMALNGAAVYQCFRVAFRRLAGGIVSLAFFAWGVLCFGGVWPIQLTPHPLRLFNRLHPMSYAHDSFVRAVEANLDKQYYSGLIALIVFTVIFLALSIVIRSVQIKKAEEKAIEEGDEVITHGEANVPA